MVKGRLFHVSVKKYRGLYYSKTSVYNELKVQYDPPLNVFDKYDVDIKYVRCLFLLSESGFMKN
jgi:hypothetical protein